MDLTQGPIAATLFRFSAPFVLSTLLQTLYSTVDSIVVGKLVGSAGLAAVSSSSQLMVFLDMFVLGFCTSGQVLIAQYRGAKNTERMRQVIGSLFWLVIGLAVVIGGLSIALNRAFLNLLNTPEEAYRYAQQYVIICSCGLLFTGLYNMFSAVFRGAGDSRHPLIFVAIASGINLVLDLLFIAVFHLGVAGAALATIIGQACSVIFSVVYLGRHGEALGFVVRLREQRFHPQTAWMLTKIGVPVGLQNSAVQVSFLFVNRQINSLGLNAAAAFAAASKIRNFPGVLSQGLSMGSTSMLGQNLGAKNYDRVKQTVLWAIVFAVIIGIPFAVVFLAWPELWFSWFTSDPEVMAYASMAMLTIVIELPARPFMVSCAALVNAQGFVQFTMFTSLLDAFAGRIFLTWFLGTFLGMGAFGMFLGYTLATYLTALPCLAYFLTGLWRKRAALSDK